MSIDNNKLKSFFSLMNSSMTEWNNSDKEVLFLAPFKKYIDGIQEENKEYAIKLAAVHLMKEHNFFMKDEMPNINMKIVNESVKLFENMYNYYLNEDGGVVSAGSGAIAGLGVANPNIPGQAEPGVTRKQANKYKSGNSLSKITPKRKILGNPLEEFKDPCWPGYEMIGMKKKDGKEVPNCVPKKKKLKEFKDPCWKGYKMIGMKKKDGKEVPNCVPKKKE